MRNEVDLEVADIGHCSRAEAIEDFNFAVVFSSICYRFDIFLFPLTTAK
jgi:hypothetical protein